MYSNYAISPSNIDKMMSRRLEERVPLLGDGEQELPENDPDDIKVSYRGDSSRTPQVAPLVEARTAGGGSLPSTDFPPVGTVVEGAGGGQRKQYTGNEMIVAVFVVQFDIRKGNVVEWRHPEEVNLEGTEFKCIASGSHNIPKDFIYFKQGQLFGLSCFEKMSVQSEVERGVRMKSVGLLAVGYLDLHLHQDFLQRQARLQVEQPGSYGSLEEYFTHYQSPRHTSSIPRPLHNGQHGTRTQQSSTPEVVHPVGAITQYLQFFGPHIFILWKLALVKKRVLIFSPPPIGGVCYRVYCTCLLTDHVLRGNLDLSCNPMFYVNVNDIDSLHSTRHYVACTSEQIMQSKTDLYDVFVDQQRLVTHLASLDPILRLTPADKERYELLTSIRSNHLITLGGTSGTSDDDYGFVDFFRELNSQLLRTMLEAVDSEDHLLTVEMVESVGLDPIRDRHFLTELAALLNFNLNVQRPSDMMDILSCCC